MERINIAYDQPASSQTTCLYKESVHVSFLPPKKKKKKKKSMYSMNHGIAPYVSSAGQLCARHLPIDHR